MRTKKISEKKIKLKNKQAGTERKDKRARHRIVYSYIV